MFSKLKLKRELSRSKDPNKSSKKNKDAKDGTASPSSTGNRDSAGQSPVLTPSSSTSTVNDIRNKPLPPGNASNLGANMSNISSDQASGQPPHIGSLGLQPSAAAPGVPDRFSSQTSGAGSAANAAAAGVDTPGRLPPTVIVSPSAPHVPPPGAAETMPHDLAPPKAGQKSSAYDRLLQSTPKDVPEGLRTPKRQHSSRFDISSHRELDKLPGFHEVPPNRRVELFMQKIDQCNVIFDFNDASSDMKSKEIKRLALHELLDYVADRKSVV